MKKLIHYRLGVSRTFPATHPRKGESTYFIEKINNCIGDTESCKVVVHTEMGDVDIWPKLHTCRSNYALWKRRFDKINKGEAVLDLFYWSGSPYNRQHDGSKQIVFATLTKDDGIGIQQLEFLNGNVFDPVVWDFKNFPQAPYIGLEILAKNDGLSLDDFKAWFKGYDLSKPLAVIHFSSFRY